MSDDFDRICTRLFDEIPAEQAVREQLNGPKRPRRQSAVIRALKRHRLPAEVRAAVKRLEAWHEIFTFTYHRATWIVVIPTGDKDYA